MAQGWAMVDSNFPMLDGNESVQEKLGQLQNYMWILTEQLRYTLDNLDMTNINESALDDFTKSFREQLEKTRKEAELSAAAIEGIRNGDSGRDERLDNLRADIRELNELLKSVSGKLEHIGQEEKTLSIGGEGITVELTGTVKVNGRTI